MKGCADLSAEVVQPLPLWNFKNRKVSEAEIRHNQRLKTLKETIEICKESLAIAQHNFDNVTEPNLIDFYIYKIQSEQSRYAQLLAEYKEEELAFLPVSAG